MTETIAVRIERICEELKDIQERLTWATQPPISLDQVRAFKSTVDDMRQFLWAYIEGMSRPNEDLALQTVRMQRASEMLRALRDDLDRSAPERQPEVRTFFEQVQVLATGAVDRHLAQADSDE